MRSTRTRAGRTAAAVALGALALAATATVGGSGASAAPVRVPLAGSFLGVPGAVTLGPLDAADMGVEVVVAPAHRTAMDQELAALYDPASPSYHHWLGRGQFVARYAPSAASIATVTRYLQSEGLRVVPSGSPFLVRAVGASTPVEHAFDTPLVRYRSASGVSFFANAAAASLPASVARDVEGVIGLSSAAREHPEFRSIAAAGHQAPRYGAGPGGSGLTPDQVAGIYDLPSTNVDRGSRATVAVFELSGYTESDVIGFGHEFYGSAYTPKIVNIDVDGGPLTPVCPAGDQCAPAPDYSGDIEVEADIETDISVAPKARQFLVYDAPNDVTGQTTVDEYMKIASDDLADSISTSWGECELDLGSGVAGAEHVAFTQMAMQGQSITAASGDQGAFDCLLDGTSNAKKLAVDDPSSQPLVTGAGGTSLGTFDPGANEHPAYPIGAVTVWNDLDACNGTKQGLKACAKLGAGGGGVSVFWGRPSFQYGPGVPNLSNRMVPDVSANADEYTPYAELCTGSRKTNSFCARFSRKQPVPGWFGVGGTSLSSPLWGAAIADIVSAQHARVGTFTQLLYPLFRSDYAQDFHDITGIDQTENNNGHYPVTPGYDLATGIGDPNFAAIVASVTAAR